MAWTDEQHDAVIKALAVTCEVTGTVYSEPARNLILEELGKHDATRVLTALRACARECKGKLSLGEIVERIERVDRKLLSDRNHAALHEETQLRCMALTAKIPWELGKEKVRAELIKQGYRLQPPSPEKQKPLPPFNERGERDE